MPTNVRKELDEEMRNIVLARLQTLSSDFSISVGSDGSFSRDELIEHVRSGDAIGREIQTAQIEWLQSLKEGLDI